MNRINTLQKKYNVSLLLCALSTTGTMICLTSTVNSTNTIGFAFATAAFMGLSICSGYLNGRDASNLSHAQTEEYIRMNTNEGQRHLQPSYT
jgi:hypothetical protein